MATAISNINGSDNSYTRVQQATNKTLEKIAASKQINSASDDASVLAISTMLNMQQNSLSQSISNANSAIAVTQISDSAMSNQSDILNQVKEKLIQASDGTITQDQVDIIAQDINKMLNQVNNIASQTNYNGQTLLQQSSTNKNQSEAMVFQVGTTSNDTITTPSIQANTTGLGLDQLLQDTANGNLTSQNARDYLQTIDNAINNLNNYKAKVGATQNTVTSSTRNLMSQEIQTANANIPTHCCKAFSSPQVSIAANRISVSECPRQLNFPTFSSSARIS